ncbi:MAG: hypothetical protein ABI781_09635 [Burkholderiales bacterium]
MDVNQPLDDSTWSARCVARMIELDPLLDPELARPIADDMGTRSRWRTMAPEDAAQAVFDFGNKTGTPPV